MDGGIDTGAAAADAADLYQRERDRILAMCMAMLGDRADAEDAVQETFARVTARLGGLRGDAGGYLVVVARNVCRDELRRRRRAAPAVESEAVCAGVAVEQTAIERSLLRSAWRRLSSPERTLLAAVFSGMSALEIADRTGLSADVIAQRISRARRHARRLVAAPAALLLPLLRTSLPARLRRLGRLPADTLAGLLGTGQSAERAAGPLLLAIIVGVLGSTPMAAPPHTRPAAPAPLAVAGEPAPVAHSSSPPRASRSAVAIAPPRAPRAPAPPAASPARAALAGNHVQSVTTSPDYTHDHTIYASTIPASCSGGPGCSALFRSQDGGRTWEQLGGAGLLGGTILLPPHFPADPTLYAVSPGAAVLRSRDGGATFQAVVPVAPTMAVIDPHSPAGDASIWMLPESLPGLLVWTEASGSLAPVTGLPVDVDGITSIFTAPGAAGVFVNIIEAVGGTSLWLCDGPASCHRAGPATGGVPVMAPSFAGDATFFLVHPGGVEVRLVSGAGDRQIDTGAGSIVEAVLPAADFAQSREVDVAARGAMGAGPLSVLRFLLGRATAALTHAWSPPADAEAFLRLPDGNVLATLGGRWGSVPTWGLSCSRDDGATWAAAC
jgi:RNA polymerase sigma-70 factor, ECF subfamily